VPESAVDLVWSAARLTGGPATRIGARLRLYGRDRVPRSGSLVLALNHLSWVDTAAFGTACPRTIYYVAKAEAISAPGAGLFLRSFGAFPIRRGESDRDAVRLMRRLVAEGRALGVFVEGTRQSAGTPGKALPGAAMVAIQEDVKVVCGAVYGSHRWRLGNFAPVSVAFAEPVRFDALPRSARGYREATAEIERRIHGLWRFLGDLHRLGRPRKADPPRDD
jgi:1-acyl-sn-glycerol-3-phosphate acyltransferase